jgi:hypothetical protein
VATIVKTMCCYMIGIHPCFSGDLAFVRIGAAHGAGVGGGCLVAIGLAVAGRAGVVLVNFPTVSPTVVGVVVVAWLWAGVAVSAGRCACIACRHLRLELRNVRVFAGELGEKRLVGGSEVGHEFSVRSGGSS